MSKIKYLGNKFYNKAQKGLFLYKLLSPLEELRYLWTTPKAPKY